MRWNTLYLYIDLEIICAVEKKMQMKKLILYSGILLFFTVVSCKSSFKVSSESLTNKNLARCETFKFFNPANMPTSNFAFSDKNKKRLFDAVADEMIKRGFRSTQDADLVIKIQGGTSQEVEDREPYYGYNDYYNRYYYGGYYPYSWSRDPWMYDDISKKTTIIIIDVMDADSDKLLWQGTGSGVLSDKADMVELNLRKAVSDIFLEFPAPLKSSN
jgi:hypothetical protein